MLPYGSRVLVAFSGGSDSTALLRLLCAVRDERRLSLFAAHFDHGLREQSADEARWARGVCGAAGVPFAAERAPDIGSGQSAYREARYGFLERESRRLDIDRIALAHQRDDQIETVLFRLGRGTGSRGLAGIPARRGNLVRPLLGFGREELRTYLSDIGQSWLRDSSNHDPRYARSRIRHRLLPMLVDATDGRVAELLLSIADAARAADRGLDRRAAERAASARAGLEQTPNGAQIARSALLGYDRAERARIVRNLARDLGFRLGRRGTAVAVAFVESGASGHGIDVAGGLRVSREYDRIRLDLVLAPVPDREVEISGPGHGAETVTLGGRRYEVRWGGEEAELQPLLRLPLRGVSFPLRVRGPRPGDRIRTRGASRRLKKLLNERRVPRSARAQVPVVVGADRRVLWVVGHRWADFEHPRPDEETFTIAIGEH